MKVLSDRDYWDNEWSSDIFTHYQQDIRHAYYINAVLTADEHKILEIAAGSFRDFAKLNALGKDCYAVDYSANSVMLAKQYHSSLADKIFCADALHLPFTDKSFDVSFHNGFWGCFDNENIREFAREQVRVTRKRIICTLHNAHNADFFQYFQRLAATDRHNDLYKVRFFTIDEASSLLADFTHNLVIIPVGKGKKTYEDDLINLGLTDAQYLQKSFAYHQMNLLNISERLLCIGEL